MANTLGNYNPIFYAQEALIHLENALGMASRVHLGFDEERRSRNEGDTISIRKPSTFAVNDAPSSAQDLATETLDIKLDQWKEVKFKLTDQELAYTQERIIRDHIRPAAYALANYIDQRIALLMLDVPWIEAATAPAAVADITKVRQNMFDRGVPLIGPMFNHLLLDGALEAEFLNLQAFSQQQGAGGAGVETQRSGSLGVKYGFETFANQNVQSVSAHTLNTTAGITVSGAHAKGVETVTITAGTLTGDLKKGNVISFAGDTQKYAVTADATAAGNAINVPIAPKLAVALSGGEAVTVEDGTAHTAPGAFHRNAFALAMAPLPDELPRRLGAQVASVMHPRSGVALRSRLYYVGNSSEVHVALDVLFGTKTLDPNLACRLKN